MHGGSGALGERVATTSEKMAYAVIVATRNGASTIKQTIDSILQQSLQAAQVCVVDDGSTDDTASILNAFRDPDKLRIVSKPDLGYDIRRVPANLNLAYASLGAAFDYLMISGDDCVYPREYAHSLITRMASDPSIAVASGRPRTGSNVLAEHTPSGSGRMIRRFFWRSVGESYPMKVGWEAWLLYKALEEGFAIRLYEDLTYEHLRPRGSMHQFAYWGSAMYSLGYHPLYALGRLVKNVVKMEITPAGFVNMLRGYLLAFLGSSDPFISTFEQSLRDFVRGLQASRISGIVSGLTRRSNRQI
jgi:glycosyltransferase involved in cell wall biosynthesis